jgi:hypothetical protein
LAPGELEAAVDWTVQFCGISILWCVVVGLGGSFAASVSSSACLSVSRGMLQIFVAREKMLGCFDLERKVFRQLQSCR